MGIPYSKEINKAFVELNKAYGQVTPLVASAYEVLETTKNISLLLLGIEILTVVLLDLILLALVGLLITMNPDLDQERKELVTPVLQWVASWARIGKTGMGGIGTMVAIVLMVSVGAVVLTTRPGKNVLDEDKTEQREGEGEDENGDEGKDKQGEKEEGKAD